jgi:hypothetical protein
MWLHSGSVQNFVTAVSRIDGLEFAGEEELVADELDENPEYYLLVPQLDALRQIVSLWESWRRTRTVPRNYTPWRDLFSQLRSVRPWGPADRVSGPNRSYFRNIVHGLPDGVRVRIEIELVFRASNSASSAAEREIADHVVRAGGAIINTARRVSAAEIRRIAALDPLSLAGADPVASIVPQSVGTTIEASDRTTLDEARPGPVVDAPIAAVFDAVPQQAHPLLAERLIVDDPTDLEARAVGQRAHGTGHGVDRSAWRFE